MQYQGLGSLGHLKKSYMENHHQKIRIETITWALEVMVRCVGMNIQTLILEVMGVAVIEHLSSNKSFEQRPEREAALHEWVRGGAAQCRLRTHA